MFGRIAVGQSLGIIRPHDAFDLLFPLQTAKYAPIPDRRNAILDSGMWL